jgi:hypothetical protein
MKHAAPRLALPAELAAQPATSEWRVVAALAVVLIFFVRRSLVLVRVQRSCPVLYLRPLAYAGHRALLLIHIQGKGCRWCCTQRPA